MVNTDKVLTQNGADFTFVCGKVPFAISCSTDLTHRNFNMIDLELINKMKIPLKNIRVTRMSMQGHDLRCVGVVSQTIQCVVNGKISGTIHLYAKVVRDLYNSISVDCLASRRTYLRLMGCDPGEEPPNNPSLEVLGGEEDADDDTDHIQESNAEGDDEGDDVREPNAKGDDVRESNAEGDDIRGSNAEGDDVPRPHDEGDDVPCHHDEGNDVPSSNHEEWQDCYDSDGNYDPVLTDYINNADNYPDDVYYQGGKLHKIKKKVSPAKPKTKPRRTTMNHCQFCFLSGQPIKETMSHNDLDIQCPSMSDEDRRRIHGDMETDKWLARIHGYHD